MWLRIVDDMSEGQETDEDNIIEYDDEPDYEFEIQPINVPDELKSKITFKSDSDEFREAKNKLKQLFKKGAKYNINGVEIKVKDELSSKPSVVEVSFEGRKGLASIKFFPGKKQYNTNKQTFKTRILFSND